MEKVTYLIKDRGSIKCIALECEIGKYVHVSLKWNIEANDLKHLSDLVHEN